MIEPTARIHPSARLAAGVTVGAYSVIEEDVRIGRDTLIANQVTICKHTTIGERNQVHPGAVIGGPPQDLTYRGEKTRLVIGSDNIIREYVTISRGTPKGGGITTIGNHNFLMACAHVAHDCILEDEIVMCNAVLLAGHVKVEKRAYICGGAAAHQFTTIGRFAFVGGMTRVVQDVPPFMIVEGHPSVVRGVNVVGLKRSNHSDESISALRDAYRIIWREDLNREEAFSRLEAGKLTVEVRTLVDFLHAAQQGKQGRAREILRNH